MNRIRIHPFAGTAWPKSVMVLALALGACTAAPGIGNFSLPGFKNTDPAPAMQFTRGRLDGLWATAPDALVMIQRGGRTDSVQMVGLDNDTSLEGDNFLWLRAHSERGGRFDLDQLIEGVGGVPSPFRSLENSDLRSGEDSLGSYFWQEYRSGTQTNCVVAFRRLGSGARALPGGTRALDVFLRNCVQGSIEQALEPIMDRRISRAAMAGPTVVRSGNRTLSPLAGPKQQ